MDLLMGTFADRHVAGFGEAELAEYDHILGEQDPDLYDWLVNRKAPPDRLEGPVFRMLLGHEFTAIKNPAPDKR